MIDVRFHPAADKESLQATEWYVERSPAAASGFVREIEHALQRIADAPERYPVTRFGRRRFVLLNYPYDVIYRCARRDRDHCRGKSCAATRILAKSVTEEAASDIGPLLDAVDAFSACPASRESAT